jgi:arylsulfatase
VETPASTLDIAATVENVVGREAGSSLLDAGAADTDRRVFSQVRGEDEHSHVRRYAVRSNAGTAFCERDTETGEVEVTEVTDRKLWSELQDHVDERVAVENGEVDAAGDEDEDMVDEEIEQRLEALGYKE